MNLIKLTTPYDITAYYRGIIIQKAIDVELRMDIIIGRYLSSNNQEKTLETISLFDNAEAIGFHAKNLCIQYILKKDYPHFLKENKGLLEKIDKLMKIRNIVAHKRPALNKGDYSVLSWAKTSKNSIGERSYIINEASIEEFENIAAEVYIALIDLEVLIINKKKTGKSN